MADSVRAVAYFRTSAAANIEGDSARRQDEAVARYAAASGIEVIACFWDAAVSGADPIETRPGFAAMLDLMPLAGVEMVLVEDASRFARSILAQELGVLALIQRGLRVVTASGQDLTDERDPSKVMLRQIAGSFSQYERARLVMKLRQARDRVRAETGRCEGRKSHIEIQPGILKEVRRLARRNPKTGKSRTLRAISAELAMLGYVGSTGKAISPSVIQKMLSKQGGLKQ